MEKKSHCRFYNNPPFVINLIQMNPLHTLPSYFIQIHFNIIFLSTPRYSKWLFLSGFPTKGFKCLGVPKLCVIFQNCLRWGGVRSSTNTEPGRAPPSAVRSCLFSMFSDTMCIWRPSPSPAAIEVRHAMVTRIRVPWRAVNGMLQWKVDRISKSKRTSCRMTKPWGKK